MIAVIFLFETAQKNLLPGSLPEPLGLLVFGVALVAFPVALRRVLARREKENKDFISE